LAIGSASLTSGNSLFLAFHIIKTIPKIVSPSKVFTTFLGRARPIIAPTMALDEAIRAKGIASLRSASPRLKSPGPAANAPVKATKSPAPLTKSRLKGKKPPTIGTNRTPPPTPPNTATIPKIKLNTNKINGQAHQGKDELVGICASPP
jgi:hypothetical protein